VGARSGLLLKGSVVISMPDYLRGLWLALEQQQGQQQQHQGQAQSPVVRWERAAVSSLRELLEAGDRPCDAVVVASGAGIR
jgi:membrane protease subunit (stomatin/prohibitin family)